MSKLIRIELNGEDEVTVEFKGWDGIEDLIDLLVPTMHQSVELRRAMFLAVGAMIYSTDEKIEEVGLIVNGLKGYKKMLLKQK